MSSQSLEAALQSAESPARMLRNLEADSFEFPDNPTEYTNWFEEQRAWRETCSFYDQSYHMVDLYVDGPDALQLFSDFGINSFENFEIGQAKQLVLCNHDGYFIADAILFKVGADSYEAVGNPPFANWLEYNLEIGEYDVTATRYGNSYEVDGPPAHFRYQIQGPNARALFDDVTHGDPPAADFFYFDEITIDGCDVHALRHGMAGEAGYEVWGPWEYADTVKDAILSTGEEYGLRRLGTNSYESSGVFSGWVPRPVPAIYNDEMKGYREWLDADAADVGSIGGSFVSDSITDYYMSPVELRYDRLIGFDHDFLGREALEAEVANPRRNLVTLIWDEEDVVDVYRSFFQEGANKKFMRFLVPRYASCHYDRVEKDGELVGVSKWMAYNYNERVMVSLCSLDVDLRDPGTRVTLIWGEPEESSKPHVEPHEQTEIGATVAPVPFVEDRR